MEQRIEDTKRGRWSAAAVRAMEAAARRPWLALGVLYLLSVAVRIALVFAAGEMPRIMTDELRYFQIAHSIFAEGALEVRGQSVWFENILYALVLAPLFALPASVNIFRAVQVLNVLMMHATIFPAYLLGLRLTGKKHVALAVAALTLLLPDMVISRYIMTESLGFPLLMLTLLLGYEMMSRRTVGHAVAAGVCSGLLYTLKPGYIALPLAFFCVWLVAAIANRDKQSIKGLVAFALSIVAVYGAQRLLLFGVLGMDAAQQGLYATQTAPFSFAHLVQMLAGLEAYAYYHLIAFGLLPVALVLSALPRYEGVKRYFAWAVVGAIAVSIVGTVYIVYVDELIKTNTTPLRVHTRYVAMYLPVLLMLVASSETTREKIGGAGLFCGLLVLLGFAQFNPQAMQVGNYIVDAPLLSMTVWQTGAYDGAKVWLYLYLPVLLLLLWMAMRKAPTVQWKRAFWVVIAATFLINGASSYQRNRFTGEGPIIAQAEEALEMTGGDAWYITPVSSRYWPSSTAYDWLARCEVPVITYDDLLMNTDGNGVCAQVLPADETDFIISKAYKPFASPSYMIFDTSLLGLVALQQGSEAVYTQGDDDSQQYAVVPMDGQTPWIHSALYDLASGQWLQEYSRFLLYDEQMRANGEITLYLYASAGTGGGTIALSTNDGQYQAFALTNYKEWVTAFTVPEDGGPFVVWLTPQSGSIYVETYLVE